MGYCPFGYRYVTAPLSQTQSSGTGPPAVGPVDGHGNELSRVCPTESRRVGLWPKSWVRNPMLRGIVPHQQGGVKPLVSPDEWEQAKRLLSSEDQFTGSDRRPTDSSFFVLNRLRFLRAFAASMRDWLSPGPMKCCYAPCDWYGRSIKESLVRTQAVEALRTESPRMAREAQRANNAKAKSLWCKSRQRTSSRNY